MKTIGKPKCDSCGGKEFEIKCVDKIKYIPASQYFGSLSNRCFSTSDTNYIEFSRYQAICKKCGHIYQYEE
jgi:rubredoxin